MDVALAVRLGMRGIEDEHLVELLGALGTVLEHGAHGGVAVDVGVLSLGIVLQRGLESQVLVNFHQPGIHLPDAGALIAIEDVALCRARVAGFHEDALHLVLDLLHGRDLIPQCFFQVFLYLPRKRFGHVMVMPTRGFCRLKDGICNFIQLKGRVPAVSFDDLRYHVKGGLLPRQTCLCINLCTTFCCCASFPAPYLVCRIGMHLII